MTTARLLIPVAAAATGAAVAPHRSERVLYGVLFSAVAGVIAVTQR